jgi:hypothetical protein
MITGLPPVIRLVVLPVDVGRGSEVVAGGCGTLTVVECTGIMGEGAEEEGAGTLAEGAEIMGEGAGMLGEGAEEGAGILEEGAEEGAEGGA